MAVGAQGGVEVLAGKSCEIRKVAVTYTAGSRGSSKEVGELIIIGGGNGAG